MTDQVLRHIIPPVPPEVDFLEVYRDAHAFYQEVRLRDELNQYCQWYYHTAEQNRRDLETMRRELNIMSWFLNRESR